MSNKKEHEHGGILGKKTELSFAILGGIFFFLGIILKYTINLYGWLILSSFMATYFFGGYFTIIEAFEKIRNKEFEIDFLMIIAAIGAAYIGSWQEGALLLFLFSIGHALENYAMGKAKKSIKALGNITPKIALIKRDNRIEEIQVEDLKINDVIIVKPSSKISADGVIIKGASSIDQSSITGESIPVDKFEIHSFEKLPKFNEIDKQHVVFTGTINGDCVLEVLVLKLHKDSTISRLIKMVSEVETQKSPTQRLTKKFEKWFVPFVLILVVSLCFSFLIIDETLNESLYRAISVLVASSPCALAISTPSAVLSGIASGAKNGVLIKGGKALEDLGSLSTIAFDKTGTLTEGKPKLTNVISLNKFDKITLVNLILSIENLSNHPLARSISRDLKLQFNLEIVNKATNIKEVKGKGIQALYEGKKSLIGNIDLMISNNIEIDEKSLLMANKLLKDGHTTMFVAAGQKLIGLLSVMDSPRIRAKETLLRLKEIGIKKMIMLTGDHQNVGDSIAKQIGISYVKGNLLPEEKVLEIQKSINSGIKIAMVGDGVNDAPAMAISTVSIAMGAAGSDVALETADIALMSDKIEKIPYVIALSRKSKQIIKQNLFISLGIVSLLIPSTILGYASIGLAVGIHEGSTLFVVINALRLLRFKDKD